MSLRYEAYRPTAPAVLRFRNAQGQVIRELPAQAAPGPHTLRWDGRDTQGHPVPPGYYDLELTGQHQRLVKLP